MLFYKYGSKISNTYVHSWPLQPFKQDYGLASHITQDVCINFIHECRDLQFKVDLVRQIFKKLFRTIFYLTLRVFAGESFVCETDVKEIFRYDV